jgi:energy-converting hydrogenase Eha subunit A
MTIIVVRSLYAASVILSVIIDASLKFPNVTEELMENFELSAKTND